MSRIFKEYKKIKQTLSNADTFNDFVVDLSPVQESDMAHWKAIIKGPQATPYHNHFFGLTITIPAEYPICPPVVRFEARTMPHCNVNFQTGDICLDILTAQHWSPVWDLLHILKAIEQLLQEPVPESPLNVDIANILKANDTSAYNGLIRYYLSKGT